MSFDLIIKNGTVILENEARVVDIAVKGGKIAAIGQDRAMQKKLWMRLVWWFRRAWLMRTPIFLNRVVATGKVMKPASRSGKRWYHHHDRNAAQPAACNG